LFLLRDESVCVAMYDNMAAVRYGHWWVFHNITLSEYVTANRDSLTSYEVLYGSWSFSVQEQSLPER
jgi:hypothetical protein